MQLHAYVAFPTMKRSMCSGVLSRTATTSSFMWSNGMLLAAVNTSARSASIGIACLGSELMPDPRHGPCRRG